MERENSHLCQRTCLVHTQTHTFAHALTHTHTHKHLYTHTSKTPYCHEAVCQDIDILIEKPEMDLSTPRGK